MASAASDIVPDRCCLARRMAARIRRHRGLAVALTILLTGSCRPSRELAVGGSGTSGARGIADAPAATDVAAGVADAGSVTGGWRTFEGQKGLVSDAGNGESLHHYGYAVDLTVKGLAWIAPNLEIQQALMGFQFPMGSQMREVRGVSGGQPQQEPVGRAHGHEGPHAEVDRG